MDSPPTAEAGLLGRGNEESSKYGDVEIPACDSIDENVLFSFIFYFLLFQKSWSLYELKYA